MVDIFQSPFSGDFLCFPLKFKKFCQKFCLAFNLHFQETFFVSNEIIQKFEDLMYNLSISIFRRLSLFPEPG